VVYIVFPLSFGKRASGLSSFSVVIHIVPILFQLFACFPLLGGRVKIHGGLFLGVWQFLALLVFLVLPFISSPHETPFKTSNDHLIG
jgi:hypothetical protein